MENYTDIYFYLQEDELWRLIDMVGNIVAEMIKRDAIHIEYHGYPQTPEVMVDVLEKGKYVFEGYVKNRLKEINDGCDRE
ncbi:MAG: hypothetical protein MJ105_07000 [Lachnospiraceae bacterium]|nr:hypothetical protein [Lachnospiraceae bacterium]